MAEKRYQYHNVLRYVESFMELPDGVLTVYNYAVDSFDDRLGKQIFGYAEFNRKLTDKEMKKYGLVPAVLDDTWI